MIGGELLSGMSCVSSVSGASVEPPILVLSIGGDEVSLREEVGVDSSCSFDPRGKVASVGSVERDVVGLFLVIVSSKIKGCVDLKTGRLEAFS